MADENKTCAQAGDIAQLISAQNKRFIFKLVPDGKFETHRGYLSHNELIGKQWGRRVVSHMGSPFVLLQPSLADILLETRRHTQIMYPKDIGFILISMDIGPGKHVLEAGTGSGSFTTALAFAVGREGLVSSYESRQEFQYLAHKNLERLGLADRVDFKLRDIAEGFDERNVDAVFLDLPNPQDYIQQAKQAGHGVDFVREEELSQCRPEPASRLIGLRCSIGMIGALIAEAERIPGQHLAHHEPGHHPVDCSSACEFRLH